MQIREFHPFEFVLSGGYLAAVYFSLFSAFSPFSTKPLTARYSYERAQLQMKRGNFANALTYIEDLTRQFPTNHVYWTLASDLYRRLGRPGDEAAALEKVMAFSSVPDEACPRIGQAYEEAGQNEKMIDALKRCLVLDARNSDFHFFMGRGFEKTGDFDSAASEFEACFKRAPAYLDCRTGLARATLRRGDASGALAILETPEASAKVEHDADALFVRALANRRMGKPSSARSDLEKATEIAPEYRDLWLALGDLERTSGNRQAALNALEKALNLKPGDPETKTLIDQLKE